VKLLSFTADSPSNALKKAQLQCGEDALVVSTKEIQKKSFNKSAVYEVVVAVEEEKLKKNKEKTAKKKSSDILLDISNAARQISQIENITSTQSVKEKIGIQTSQKKQEDKSYKEIKEEISKLSDKVKLIQNMFWEEKAPQRGDLNIPSEFAEIYKKAKLSGMDENDLNSIMELTLEHMPYNMRKNSASIKRYFQVLLRKMIPVRLESDAFKDKKRIMMFVGPTGVGKTTTLAKLAARYSYLKEKREKVGIITLDTYRIGAVEQLFQFAKMMRLPIEDVIDISDFARSLRSLAYCDTILIDTIGSSQYDKEKLEKIEQFLKNSQTEIDVNLVLSSSTKLDDLREIYASFEYLDIDTIIFTKFDETKSFGNIFSLVKEVSKPLSYFSVGQEVPDDIMAASSEFLVDCILDGFKKDKDANSSR
jgi:flagellar biosynthesis protein FlhF